MKMKLCIYIFSSSEQYIYEGYKEAGRGGEWGLYIFGKLACIIWIWIQVGGNIRSWGLDKSRELFDNFSCTIMDFN